MEDQGQDPNSPRERNEPVRSRWTPKPEQILILESIFNSGMVNPPKDETVKIRKLLEKFGSVGDANVFYWFQNRRSRSRRRQRQIQASLAGEQQGQATISAGSGSGGGGGAIQYESGTCASGFLPNSPNYMVGQSQSSNCLSGGGGGSGSGTGGASSSCGEGVEDLFSFSGQMGFQGIEENSSHVSSVLGPCDTTNFQYQPGIITVFINGVPTEVGRGPIDMRGMFGEEVVLVHSSGIPVPLNDFGFSLHTLHHGESYFLVSRHT